MCCRRSASRPASLEGGYKAYRSKVVEDLKSMPGQFQFRVICGPTGSGKSRLLGALNKAGAQVLDLEDLAVHRGSVLGVLPDHPQPTQKAFESALWSRLHAACPRTNRFTSNRKARESAVCRFRTD